MDISRIRALREDNDYKQTQLAELLHVKQSTYSDYENGRIGIPLEAMDRLAAFYRTSIDYLVGRTDEPKPYPKRQVTGK